MGLVGSIYTASTIGPKLKGIRAELGISQGEAAAASKVTTQTLWLWESGAKVPLASNLARLLDFYSERGANVSMDEVMGR